MLSHGVLLRFGFWPLSLTSPISCVKKGPLRPCCLAVPRAAPGRAPCLPSRQPPDRRGEESSALLFCSSALAQEYTLGDVWKIPLPKESKAIFSSFLMLIFVAIEIDNNSASLFSLNLGFQS